MHCSLASSLSHQALSTSARGVIGMYLHGFEKHILSDINKRSSTGERWEQAEP